MRLLFLVGLGFCLPLTVAACGSTASLPQGLQGFTYQQPVAKPDFVLTDTAGRAFDFRKETEGRLTLLFFGYTNCPDVCPVQLGQLAQVFATHPDLGRAATVVFVGVDYARDTPQAVREYLDRFDSRFIGLVGDASTLEEAQRASQIPVAYREQLPEVDEDNPQFYSYAHSGTVLAFAPDGYSYSTYPSGVRQSEWVNDLTVLAEVDG